jgi:hypothetical protein
MDNETKVTEEILVVEELDDMADNGNGGADNGRHWSEEFVVAGEELVDTVKKLMREVTVRRLVVKNEKMNLHLEVPLILGVAGIALLPVYSAMALIAALVVDCTILVERHEPVHEKGPETAEA